MQRFARTKLALVALAAAAPLAARAGEIPSFANGGYKTPAPSAPPRRDGAPIKARTPARTTALASPSAMPTAAPVAAMTAAPMIMTEAEARSLTPPPRIVACAHSRNGVCPPCQAVLEMPGTVTMVGANPGAPAMVAANPAAPAMVEAPGRAVVSAPGHSHAHDAAGQALAQATAPEDGPMPIGVVQTNFQQGGRMPMPAPSARAAARPSAPGHAVAASDPGAGQAPYQKPRAELRPNILGHLFGWSYIGKDWRDGRQNAASQAHASIRYDDQGKAVTELPRSMVHGPR